MRNDQPMRAPIETGGALHKMLRMTPDDVRREMASLGLDFDAEVAAMRRLGRALQAAFLPQAERERQLASRGPRLRPLPMHRDAVAAGPAQWTESSGAGSGTEFFDMVDKADPAAMYWAPVRGWSMRDAGINDGDMVLVDTKARARDGDIVLAHLAGEGQLVKRLRIIGDAARLESENPDFKPIPVPDFERLRIHGVVVGRAGKTH